MRTTRTRRPLRRLFYFVALLLFCAHITGCDGLGKKLNQWFPRPSSDDTALHHRTKAGKQLFQQKKYAEALQLFLELQSQHPQHLDLMYNLGAVHLRLGEAAKDKGDKRKSHFKKAETYLNATLTKGSAKLRQKAQYNLGMLFTHKHQYEKALYHFEQADYLARKVLKRPDKDAASNRDLLATLLRQRNRRRKKLNRTRVFRYEAKIIQLRAAKSYKDPVRDIALQATFTHQGTSTKQVVWGYPISAKHWQVRFIPTRTGKWRYKIKTIARNIPGLATKTPTAPGKPGATTHHKTKIDKSLQDSGLFRVMPSARAGDLIIATANPTKFAWKKPKSALKLKQKKAKGAKSAAKAPKKPGTTGPKRPTPKAAKGKAKGKKKPPTMPKDETIIRWQGLQLTGLFHPKKTNDKLFAAHLGLLRAVNPTAIHVPIPLDGLLRWPKKGAPQLAGRRLHALAARLKLLRAHPSYKWAFVYVLQSTQKLDSAKLHVALSFLTARLGHVDAIWSTSQLPKQTATLATKLLQKLDPYKQPIAGREMPALLKAQLASRKQIAQKRRAMIMAYQQTVLAAQKAHAANKAAKKGSKPKLPKPPKLPPLPKLSNKRFVLHSSHHIATNPKALQTALVTPWIGDLPIFMGLDDKGLLGLWWKLYVSGTSASVVLNRTFHTDELKDITEWLAKAEGAEKLPPHPDDVKKKIAAKSSTKLTKNTKKVAAKVAPKVAPKKGATKLKKASGALKKGTLAKAGAKAGTKAGKKAAKKVAKKAVRTPKDKRISRPFLHYVMVRQRWIKFLDSFRFDGLVRPMTVQVRIPDMKAFRAAVKTWTAKKAKKAASKPALAPKPKDKLKDKQPTKPAKPAKPTKPVKAAKPKAPPMPKMRWKAVPMRGYLAGNVTTILFLAPNQKVKKPPQIRWKKRRMDMEFSWYNAKTGKFLDKQVFRQVISLALVAPKKKAHIAKVVIKDHKVHTPYDVALPHRLAPVTSKSAWRAKDWQLLVTPPKGPKQRLTAILHRRGYVARFRPDQPGFWRFTLLYKGKRLKGIWGYDGMVKAVPARQPMPLLRHPRMPKRFLAGVMPKLGPVLTVATPVPSLLSTWTDEQALTTIAQLKQQRPAGNLLIAKLPQLPWHGFDQPKQPKAPTPAKAPKSPKAAKNPKNPKAAPKAKKPLALPLLAPIKRDPAARLKFLQAVERLERRIAAVSKSGRLLAIMLSPQRWKGLLPQQRQARMFFLLDRFATAYPLLWLVDHRDPKSKPNGQLTRLIKIWYMIRYPHPSFKRKPKAPKPKKPKKQIPPSAWPPLVGVAMGSLRSEKRLKLTKGYDFLWLTVENLNKDVRDFKLLKDPRPMLLTWKPLLQENFQWKTGKGKQRKWDQKQLKTWARFLWRAQLMGFSHVEQALEMPMVSPLQKKTKKKDKQPLTIEKLAPPARIPAVMQAFFQTFDWSRLAPPIRSMGLKDYQAFGAETPYQPKGKGKSQHHAVIWVNQTVRKELLLTQKTPLKKHRYVWINPLNGQQPVSPQLLPLAPKGKPNALQVPFRPALLYVFRRPPQKKQQKRRKQQKKQKKQRTSKRQRVRNRLKNLKDDRNKMLKKMLGKQKRRSGKRG